MIRVAAPSRLHFGLFHVPSAGEARPGRASRSAASGLMIESPGGRRDGPARADSWQFEGPLASRAQAFAMRFMQSLPEADRRPFQVLVEQCPAEHTGLGVGTQLALAVAKALAVASGRRPLVGRTRRTRRPGGTLGDRRSRVRSRRVDRRGREARRGRGVASAACEPLADRVAGGAVPPAGAGVARRPRAGRVRVGGGGRPGIAPEYRRIGDAPRRAVRRPRRVRRGGPRVQPPRGRAVRAAQGGPYASPAVAELIAELRSLGIRGVGQSSWGPTVFAVVADGDTALSLVLRFRSRLPVTVSRPSAGHRVESVEPLA